MKKILTTTALIGSTLIASSGLSSAQVSMTGQLDLSYKAIADKNTHVKRCYQLTAVFGPLAISSGS